VYDYRALSWAIVGSGQLDVSHANDRIEKAVRPILRWTARSGLIMAVCATRQEI